MDPYLAGVPLGGSKESEVRCRFFEKRATGKAVEALTAFHEAQLLTYLRLSRRRLGLLINFNVVVLKNGIKRMIL